jgi:hypothetical protein
LKDLRVQRTDSLRAALARSFLPAALVGALAAASAAASSSPFGGFGGGAQIERSVYAEVDWTF